MTTEAPTFGDHLRRWRARRRMSQLELAAESGVSARHVGFIETGRSNPSRDMVLLLTDRLEVPLRARNAMLLAAGYAPIYEEHRLDEPAMASVREAVELVVRSHDPYPAIAVDGRWDVVVANTAATLLIEDVAPEVLGPPLNVYRVSLHPEGMARTVVNFDEYASHLLARLRHDVASSGDPRLGELLAEVESYGTVTGSHAAGSPKGTVVLPMRVRCRGRELSLFSTIATFGTPVDIAVAELAIETFFPTDEPTASFLRELAAPPAPS